MRAKAPRVSSRASRLRSTALTPRWLGLLALALAFAVICILLGRWQWDRTQTILAAERASQAVPVEVSTLVPEEGEIPNEHIGRPVIAVGEYDEAGQVTITSRELDGNPGVWLWTPLMLDDGSTIGVVRGWLPSSDAPGSQPPRGLVSIAGVLHPDERFYPDATIRDDTALAIDSTRLGATRSGFIVLRSQEPAVPPAPLPVPQTVVTADVPFPVQNFFYAFQWWLFAVFGLAMWGVWLWREAREADDATSVSAP